MKRAFLFLLVLGFLIPFSGYSQFGIQNAIKAKYKAKYEKEGRKQAEKGLEKAENKGMEEADKGLDKATDAAAPGIKKAEEAQQQGEDYAVEGAKKYQKFTEDYEADVNAKDPADYKKYPFESAIIEYKLEGSEKGTKTLYIDMGGYKTAEYKTIKERKKDKKSTVIMIGSDMITIDYENKSAYKMHNPMAYLLADPDRDWQKTGEKILVKMGYEIIGTETIEGKKCAIWKQGGQRLWLWHGITMKSVNKVMGVKNIETVTDLKIDTKVPENVFSVPEGFELETTGPGDMFPSITDEDINQATSQDDEDMDAILDQIENMSYSDYKAKVLEEEPGASDEEIRQSYLYLRQKAKMRHK